MGSTPPRKNSVRQSNPGGSSWVVRAASPPPTGMPQNMIAAVDAALPGRLISEAIAIRLGKAAPNPRPAQNRTANSAS